MAVLVGKKAPDFTASAVMPDNSIVSDFNLVQYSEGAKAVVLFFYPLDFTFVCPSEILEFNKRLPEFESKGVKVVGISIDSQFTHLAYKNTPINSGGIGHVQFPLVADLTKNIAREYDVLTGEAVALRGTFLIDSKGVVRHQLVNDLPLGRNVNESLRMVDALLYFETHGEVCPANWTSGEEAMKPTQEGVKKYLSSKHG